MAYASMTQPWLRNNVIFIHGNNSDSSTPFTLNSLPTKYQIREKSTQLSGPAILDTFVRKELESTEYLLYLLRKEEIEYPIPQIPIPCLIGSIVIIQQMITDPVQDTHLLLLKEMNPIRTGILIPLETCEILKAIHVLKTTHHVCFQFVICLLMEWKQTRNPKMGTA